MRFRVGFKVEGMRELQKSFRRLGDVPQKHVTTAAKKAMNIPLKEAKTRAPVLTGNLRQGIISVGERARVKGKKVYRIVFDRAMNAVFQKPVKNPGESGSPNAKDPAYYPVSQEYGFFARNGRYIPGFNFAHKTLVKNTSAITRTIVTTMKKKIDQEIAKVGLK